MTTTLKALLISELERELRLTRRVLARLPEGALDRARQVGADGETLGQLANDLVELPGRVARILAGDGIGPARTHPGEAASRSALLRRFDANAEAARAALAECEDGVLAQPWTLRRGGRALHRETRAVGIRTLVLDVMGHHRPRLGAALKPPSGSGRGT